MLMFPYSYLRLFLGFLDRLDFLVHSGWLAAFNGRGLFIIGSAGLVDFRFYIAISSF